MTKNQILKLLFKMYDAYMEYVINKTPADPDFLTEVEEALEEIKE